MVRLEIIIVFLYFHLLSLFTFQYGQIRNYFISLKVSSVEYIYIPVWLDQKFSNFHKVNFSLANLHSSMVRLEIHPDNELLNVLESFTFQYGQIRNEIKYGSNSRSYFIYIPVWLDQKYDVAKRQFIGYAIFTFQYGQIRNDYFTSALPFRQKFTFQYGQIRNLQVLQKLEPMTNIYIPVWLDQKFFKYNKDTKQIELFTFQYGQIRNIFLCIKNIFLLFIYIPVWLDQKSSETTQNEPLGQNLHSSMVRLEMVVGYIKPATIYGFTFQYGQIRN